MMNNVKRPDRDAVAKSFSKTSGENFREADVDEGDIIYYCWEEVLKKLKDYSDKEVLRKAVIKEFIKLDNNANNEKFLNSLDFQHIEDEVESLHNESMYDDYFIR